MAEFPPKNQRDQVLSLVALLGVAAIGLFYVYVWSGTHDELNERDERVTRLTAINDSSKKEMAGGTLQALEAEAARLRTNLDVMRRLVPTGNEVPLLLEQVSSAARRAGLDLADVQPEPVLRGSSFDAHRYKMAVIGDYHAIGEFLSNVGGLTRIITPMNLALVPTTARSAKRPREGQQFLEARFEIQTYVAKTRPEPAGGTR
ncbi:MAG: type 4a pilus biogenesis protein PilO [Gemmatimonadaceae bacterium]|nr:type 4a pilus biogenesis protein PilO [Gemmatimonadaceae bacterium]